MYPFLGEKKKIVVKMQQVFTSLSAGEIGNAEYNIIYVSRR